MKWLKERWRWWRIKRELADVFIKWDEDKPARRLRWK